MKLIAPMLFVVLFSVNSESQVTITGHVRDLITKNGIANAEVTTAGNLNEQNDLTDMDGYFELKLKSSAKPGSTFRLRIKPPSGYRDLDKVEIVSYKPIEDIFLEKERTMTIIKQKKKIKPGSKKGFTLNPYNISLASALKKEFKRSVSQAQNQGFDNLQLSASGENVKVSNGLEYYPGGHVVLKINGLTCHDFTDYVIEKTPFQGNTKSEVDSYINNQISNFVSTHKITIMAALKECLN